jgi:hypothetical protein
MFSYLLCLFIYSQLVGIFQQTVLFYRVLRKENLYFANHTFTYDWGCAVFVLTEIFFRFYKNILLKRRIQNFTHSNDGYKGMFYIPRLNYNKSQSKIILAHVTSQSRTAKTGNRHNFETFMILPT